MHGSHKLSIRNNQHIMFLSAVVQSCLFSTECTKEIILISTVECSYICDCLLEYSLCLNE